MQNKILVVIFPFSFKWRKILYNLLEGVLYANYFSQEVHIYTHEAGFINNRIAQHTIKTVFTGVILCSKFKSIHVHEREDCLNKVQ